MTPTDSLGLRKLEPEQRGGGKPSRFTDDEWLQIEMARGRGMPWRQILEHTGKRYKNESALSNAFQAWRKKR